MEARYDDAAEFYAGRFEDNRDGVLEVLIDLLGDVRGKPVLDIACALGRVTRHLQGLGADATGLDLSAAMLAIARDRSHGIRYLHGDAADAPALRDGEFDAVTCGFGLSDIDDLDATLRTVRRVLRPGGVFVFSILHPCFPGAGEVSGAFAGNYHDEGFFRATDAASTLRQRVGANHRTLSTYVNAVVANGLVVDRMAEPPARWSEPGRREATRFPAYLVLRCRT